MKILYGITKSNFGGAQRYVFDLARLAQKQGHDVAVLCGGEGTLVKKLREEHIRVISIPGFGRDMDLAGDFTRLLFIMKTVYKERPDVFHINSAKMGGAGIFSGRLLGVPKIIFTAHGWAFNEPRALWQKKLITFFSWMTVFSAHLTICVSEKTKRDIAHFPFIQNKMRVIYNGIAPFELLPRTNTGLTVGTIAELHQIKGLDVLLNAWVEFRKQKQGKLVVFGEGEERHHLTKLAEHLGIADSVTFKGFVDNAKAHLSELDIFVLPSRSEALPYTILEAGTAGLPTVASAVGGIPEIITNNKSGLLVPAENAEALIEALLTLAESETLRASLGTALKETIKQKFSLEKMWAETSEAYYG